MSNACWPVAVFDLDGTVVNTIPLIIASYEHAVTSVLGVSPDPVEARSWIGQTLAETFYQRYPENGAELVASYVAWNTANLERLVRESTGAITVVESGPYGRITSRNGQAFTYDGAGRRLEDDQGGGGIGATPLPARGERVRSRVTSVWR